MNETQQPKQPITPAPRPANVQPPRNTAGFRPVSQPTPRPPVSQTPVVQWSKVVQTPRPIMPRPFPQQSKPAVVVAKTPTSAAPMQWNLSIDFSKKNNVKTPYKGKRPLHSQGPKMNSEAFIRQSKTSALAGVQDLKKTYQKRWSTCKSR